MATLTEPMIVSGTEYSTKEEFLAAIEKYDQFNGSKFRIANTSKQDEVTKDLPFSSITMRCERAGDFKPRGNNVRKTKSKKCGCLAVIRANVSNNKLRITTFNLEHNHELNKDCDKILSTADNKSGNSENPKDDSLSAQNVPNTSSQNCQESVKTISDNEADNESGNLENPKDNSLSAQNVPNTSSQNCQESVKTISDNEANNESVNSGNSKDNSFSADLSATTDGGMDLTSDVTSLQNIESMIDSLKQKETAEIDKKNPSDVDAIISKLKSFMYSLPDNQKGKGIQMAKNMLEKIAEDLTSEPKPYAAVKMPESISSIGRPKGSKLTVIGLQSTIPKSFNLQKPSQQILSMFDWLKLEANVLKNVLDKEYLLKFTDLKNVNVIIQPFLNKTVDEKLLESYMSSEGFKKFQSEIKKYIKQKKFICAYCLKKLSESCIGCDHCMVWIDLECAGFTTEPDLEVWYCKKCEEKFLKNHLYV